MQMVILKRFEGMACWCSGKALRSHFCYMGSIPVSAKFPRVRVLTFFLTKLLVRSIDTVRCDRSRTFALARINHSSLVRIFEQEILLNR